VVIEETVEDALCPGSASADRRKGVAPLEEVWTIWY